jgi:hypothetical protein
LAALRQSAYNIGRLLRDHFAAITAFEADSAACLEIY